MGLGGWARRSLAAQMPFGFAFPVDGEDVVTPDDLSAPGMEGEGHLVPGDDADPPGVKRWSVSDRL